MFVEVDPTIVKIEHLINTHCHSTFVLRTEYNVLLLCMKMENQKRGRKGEAKSEVVCERKCVRVREYASTGSYTFQKVRRKRRTEEFRPKYSHIIDSSTHD